MKLMKDIALIRESPPMSSALYADWPELDARQQAELRAFQRRLSALLSAEREAFAQEHPELTIKLGFTITARVKKDKP